MLAMGLVGFAVVLAIAMVIVKVLTNGVNRKRHAMAGDGGTAWMSDSGSYGAGDGSDCGSGDAGSGGCSDGGGGSGGGD